MKKANSITIGLANRPVLSRDGRTIVVRIPISIRRQKDRKRVLTLADAAPWTPPPARIDSTMVKAIVRGHRWRDMLESGRYNTLRELAKAEKINEAYLGRVLRLTLLSPQITNGILSGQQSDNIDVADLLKPFPVEWENQHTFFVVAAPSA
jgi:hypothetical protein